MSWQQDIAKLRAGKPRHILFLCVQNSARSQIAEGVARSLAPASVLVSSAGSSPASVRPEAIEAMAEIGIDISGHESKGLDRIDLTDVDAIITLCDDEVCPTAVAAASRCHWAFKDPAGGGLETYRRVRDELLRRLTELFEPERRRSP